MAKAKVDQLKQLLKKDKDPSAIEQELANYIDDLPKVPGFVGIGVESASRICSYVPNMKTETAKAIISKFFETYAQESLILLSSIECGKIGVAAAEVIAPLLVFPLLREAVYIDNSPIPDFADLQKKIEDLRAQNAKLSALNERLEELLAPEEKKSLPVVIPQRPEKLNENIHNDASKGDIDSVRFLLARDRSLAKKTDSDNRTPLHYAARDGHTAICSLLIENGADIEARDNNIYFLYRLATPLHIAAGTTYLDVVNVLIANGANRHAKDDFNATFLEYFLV
jgi:hypothetical protein